MYVRLSIAVMSGRPSINDAVYIFSEANQQFPVQYISRSRRWLRIEISFSASLVNRIHSNGASVASLETPFAYCHRQKDDFESVNDRELLPCYKGPGTIPGHRKSPEDGKRRIRAGSRRAGRPDQRSAAGYARANIKPGSDKDISRLGKSFQQVRIFTQERIDFSFEFGGNYILFCLHQNEAYSFSDKRWFRYVRGPRYFIQQLQLLIIKLQADCFHDEIITKYIDIVKYYQAATSEHPCAPFVPWVQITTKKFYRIMHRYRHGGYLPGQPGARLNINSPVRTSFSPLSPGVFGLSLSCCFWGRRWTQNCNCKNAKTGSIG